jgi:hypothetical protein
MSEWDRIRASRASAPSAEPHPGKPAVDRRRPADGKGDPAAEDGWREHPPRDVTRGRRLAVCQLVADLASAPLDHDRPLWEVYLIDGFGTGAAVLTRVHHAIADGIALARVMLSVTDAVDDGAGSGRSARLRARARAARRPRRARPPPPDRRARVLGRRHARQAAARGVIEDPQPLADAFRSELLSLARRARPMPA